MITQLGATTKKHVDLYLLACMVVCGAVVTNHRPSSFKQQKCVVSGLEAERLKSGVSRASLFETWRGGDFHASPSFWRWPSILGVPWLAMS